MPRLGLIIDLEKCYGCDACGAACQNEHLWPQDVPFNRIAKEPESHLERLTAPLICMQCDDAACLSHCAFDALRRDRDGVVQVENSCCTGCGACVDACPYDAIATTRSVDYDRLRSMMTPDQRARSAIWDLRRKKHIPAKCDLCADRRKDGRLPACVAVCPTAAFIFGDLSDPSSEISRRVTDPQVVSAGDSGSPRVFYRLPSTCDRLRLRQLLKRK